MSSVLKLTAFAAMATPAMAALNPPAAFISEICPVSAPFFGFMGVVSALVFANLGAAYGTAKSGVGLSSMGVFNPTAVMRNIIPIIMAGVLGIYGLITAVIIQGQIVQTKPVAAMMSGSDVVPALTKYSAYDGYRHLAAGLVCGLSGLAAGMAIGVVGDAGVRAVGLQADLFVPSVLILIFAEALALYGLIIGLILGVAPLAAACDFSAETWVSS
jgi:V-type H+-transporting ATPase proteolipid subunit